MQSEISLGYDCLAPQLVAEYRSARKLGATLETDLDSTRDCCCGVAGVVALEGARIFAGQVDPSQAMVVDPG